MNIFHRRRFMQLASAAYLSPSFGGTRLCTMFDPFASSRIPRLGTVTKVYPGTTIDAAIKRVHDLGLPTCQIFFENLTLDEVKPLKAALTKYDIEVTALSEHNPGPRVFDFYQGPLTVGIIPQRNPNHRARIEALKKAAHFAQACGIPAVHSHLGFMPEDPNDPIYPHAIAAIREVAQYCKEEGRILLSETGEETPISMVRTIQDVGTGNIFINLDTANLILCGKGNPVDAMDVFGDLVRGIHAKDGLFPTDPRFFGKEVPIGQGRVDFPALFKRLRQVNYTGAITIEREIEGPQQIEDILKSKAFLQDLIDRTYS
jgi:L-ribulose-5-phosphate 3-epimerase